MSQAEGTAAVVRMLRSIADDVESGRAVMIDQNVEATIIQLTPLPGEEWVMSSNTGRVKYTLDFVIRETEVKHAKMILSREADR